MEGSRPVITATSTLGVCLLFAYLPIYEFIIDWRVKTVMPVNLPLIPRPHRQREINTYGKSVKSY